MVDDVPKTKKNRSLDGRRKLIVGIGAGTLALGLLGLMLFIGLQGTSCSLLGPPSNTAQGASLTNTGALLEADESASLKNTRAALEAREALKGEDTGAQSSAGVQGTSAETQASAQKKDSFATSTGHAGTSQGSNNANDSAWQGENNANDSAWQGDTGTHDGDSNSASSDAMPDSPKTPSTSDEPNQGLPYPSAASVAVILQSRHNVGGSAGDASTETCSTSFSGVAKTAQQIASQLDMGDASNEFAQLCGITVSCYTQGSEVGYTATFHYTFA